jgi:hypothetical protein
VWDVLIDCETCVARDLACRDCVVTFLLDRPPIPVELDDDEQAAIGSLVRVGLVPPLRLAAATDGTEDPGSDVSEGRAGSRTPRNRRARGIA